MSAPTVAVDRLGRARAVAEGVTDPELPDLTIADLGVLRGVEEHDGTVVVTVTPTFSGCPALATILTDLDRRLAAADVAPYRIETVLRPAWSSAWITEAGRERLRRAGIAPPAGHAGSGPVEVTVGRRPDPVVRCPRCGAEPAALLSWYAATPCRSLYRCGRCQEPFDAIKPV